TPVLAQAVSRGHAYYAMDLTRPNGTGHSVLVDYDLERGTQRNLVEYPQAWVNDINANEGYVVVQLGKQLLIYDNEGRLLHSTDPASVLINRPRLGGDWVVYSHYNFTTSDPAFLAALNIKTKTLHSIIQDSKYYDVIDWATDGHQAVVELYTQPGASIFKYKPTTELYWMDLPRS
ncbi:MAG: hypothetical protein LC623_08860, partial [Halobacteriales archaeon]|nr:hypothetical protein [Halobacteriales archaeon]